MRNSVVLTVLMMLVAPLGTDQAIAAGAVAIGIAPGGAARGYATGSMVNEPDIDTAKASALAACKRHRANISGTAENSGSRAAQAKCEVVATFVNKCYAQALDTKDGTPGVGWAVADTQREADDEAIARCRSTAGAARRNFCKVVIRNCDGRTQ
jgi:hypothetical protein